MSYVIIEKLSNDEITKRGIKSWPIGQKKFPIRLVLRFRRRVLNARR
jgi:hypothetical protein